MVFLFIFQPGSLVQMHIRDVVRGPAEEVRHQEEQEGRPLRQLPRRPQKIPHRAPFFVRHHFLLQLRVAVDVFGDELDRALAPSAAAAQVFFEEVEGMAGGFGWAEEEQPEHDDVEVEGAEDQHRPLPPVRINELLQRPGSHEKSRAQRAPGNPLGQNSILDVVVVEGGAGREVDEPPSEA